MTIMKYLLYWCLNKVGIQSCKAYFVHDFIAPKTQDTYQAGRIKLEILSTFSQNPNPNSNLARKAQHDSLLRSV